LFRGRYRRYKPSIKYIDFKHTSELMVLGSRFFIIQVSFVVIFTTSNIIITQLLGPQEVTVYNIAYKYFSIPVMAYSVIMTPIWSAVTDAYVKEDVVWLKNVIKKLNHISIVFVVGILIMLLLSGSMYHFWVGNRVSVPFVLSATMALYAVINVILSPYTQYISGLGKLKLVSLSAIFLLIFFIPISIILTKTTLGVAGPMMALCLMNGIGLILQPIQTYKLLNNKAYGIWGK
jgi:O-antigen/teichoic acid export membrane protein